MGFMYTIQLCPPKPHLFDIPTAIQVKKATFMVCLVRVKTGRMENKEKKIGWKMMFSIIWLVKKNRRYRKQGRKLSPLGPLF